MTARRIFHKMLDTADRLAILTQAFCFIPPEPTRVGSTI